MYDAGGCGSELYNVVMTRSFAFFASGRSCGILQRIARIFVKNPCRSSMAAGFLRVWMADF